MTAGKRIVHALTVFTGVTLMLGMAVAEDGIIQPTSGVSATGNLSGRDISKTLDNSGLSGSGTSGDILSETHINTSGGKLYWIATYAGAELTFDLGGTYDVDRVHIWNYNVASGANNRCIKSFDISFSTDGGSTYSNTVVGLGDFAQQGAAISSASPADTITFTAMSNVTDIKLSNIVNYGSGTHVAMSEIRFGELLPPDVTVPGIAALSPTNTTTAVATTTDLVISFDEDVQKGTNGNIVIQQTAGGTFETIAVTSTAVTVSETNVTINPSSTLAGLTGYYVEIDAGAITDIASNSFAGISGSNTWSFVTESVDVVAPMLAALSPTNGSTGVATDTDLVISFNENVQKGSSGNIVIQQTAGGTFETIAVTSPNVTVSGTNVTISTTADFSKAAGYYVEFDNGAIEDLSGNAFAGISGSGTWSFETFAGALVATDLNGGGGTDSGFAPGGSPNGWQGSGNVFISAASDLTYANYAISQSGTPGNVYACNGAHNDRMDSRNLATSMSGDIWFSTLVNVPAGAGFAGLAFDSDLYVSGAARYSHQLSELRVVLSSSALIVDMDGGAPPTATGTETGSPAAATTHLILGQMNVVAGNDTISVWVDPDLSSVGEPGDLPAANFTSTTVDFMDSVSRIGVPLQWNGSSSPHVDAIWLSDRSTAFMDVTGVTGPDVTAPLLADLSPTNTATGVSEGANLVLTLDENAAKGTNGNIVIQQIAGGTFETIAVTSANVTVSSTDVTINPTGTFAPLTGYYVEIDAGAITDTAGTPNDFAGFSDSNTWSFVTANSDITPPSIAVLSPTNNATGVSVSTDLVISFDEDVAKGSSGNIVIQQSAGGTFETIAVTSPNVTVSGTNVTISPSSDFTKSAGYYVEIDNGAIEDLAGNPFAGISGSGTWSFEIFAGTFVAADINTGGADTGFSGGWSGSSGVSPVTTDDLAYGPYAITQSGSPERVYSGSTTHTDRQDSRSLSATLSGDIWFSVLVHVPAAATFSGLSFHTTAPSPAYSHNLAAARVVMSPAQLIVDLDGGALPAGSGSFASDTTHLLLGQMNVVAGNDTISVWVDPDLSAVTGPGDLPAADFTSTTVDFTDGIANIGVPHSGGSGVETDAIRLSDRSTAFLDVTGLGVVETTAPTIAALSPTHTETGVAVATDLVITFDEPVKKGSGNIVIQQTAGGTFETIPVGSAAVTLIGGGAVRINPSSDLAGITGYYVEIDAGAITDFAATPNNFAGISGSGTWSFTTVATDVTGPSIAALSPANSASGVSLDTELVISFDEDVQKGSSGNIVIQQTAGGTFETIAVTSPNVTVSGSNVTISTSSNLAKGTAYYVEIDSGAIEDLFANVFTGISGAGTWGFTISSGSLAATDLNTGGTDTGFSGGWSGSSNLDIINATDLGSLNYFITQGGSTERVYQSDAASTDRQDSRFLALAKAGEVWFSIVVNVPASGGFAGISFHESTPSAPYKHSEADARVLLTPTSLIVDLDGGDPPVASGTETGTFAAGITHLLLGQMILGVGNDTINVWVDPDLFFAEGAGDLPAANFSSTTVDFMDFVTIVGVPGYKGSAVEVYMDAIWVSDSATAFRDVAGPRPGTTVMKFR